MNLFVQIKLVDCYDWLTEYGVSAISGHECRFYVGVDCSGMSGVVIDNYLIIRLHVYVSRKTVLSHYF